jgi:hypothetical protein
VTANHRQLTIGRRAEHVARQHAEAAAVRRHGRMQAISSRNGRSALHSQRRPHSSRAAAVVEPLTRMETSPEELLAEPIG